MPPPGGKWGLAGTRFRAEFVEQADFVRVHRHKAATGSESGQRKLGKIRSKVAAVTGEQAIRLDGRMSPDEEIGEEMLTHADLPRTPLTADGLSVAALPALNTHSPPTRVFEKRLPGSAKSLSMSKGPLNTGLREEPVHVFLTWEART